MSGGPFSSYRLQDAEGSRLIINFPKLPEHEMLSEMQGYDFRTSWPMRTMKNIEKPKTTQKQHK